MLYLWLKSVKSYISNIVTVKYLSNLIRYQLKTINYVERARPFPLQKLTQDFYELEHSKPLFKDRLDLD